ncbi:DUF1707 and DUF4870 domain-containing protein [Nocardiopsis sediminis]|uniref:DUF1707 and DUF4870 domain-containing protein n=1 Tax=Nocardiopsis sediminis TaxID=1778267 RepID=A0ABV8FUP2_9ACTN
MAVHEPMTPPGPERRWGAVPGPSGSASPNPQLRLTHADRDAVAERLREAYAAGQLDDDELEERLGLALRAKVGSELTPLLSDLQPEPAAQSASLVDGAAPAADGPLSGADRLMAFAGHASGYFSFVGPLVMLLASRDSSPFVRRHAMEALNYQITFAVASIVMLGLAWLIIPLVAWVLMLLGWCFMPIVAGLVALLGGGWRYPFTWRPVKGR